MSRQQGTASHCQRSLHDDSTSGVLYSTTGLWLWPRWKDERCCILHTCTAALQGEQWLLQCLMASFTATCTLLQLWLLSPYGPGIARCGRGRRQAAVISPVCPLYLCRMHSHLCCLDAPAESQLTRPSGPTRLVMPGCCTVMPGCCTVKHIDVLQAVWVALAALLGDLLTSCCGTHGLERCRTRKTQQCCRGCTLAAVAV